jgi:hypothetical protein
MPWRQGPAVHGYGSRLLSLLAGVPGIARDEKLRKQVFKITWRDKSWIG